MHDPTDQETERRRARLTEAKLRMARVEAIREGDWPRAFAADAELKRLRAGAAGQWPVAE
ncbi:hypothetical protein CTZ27_12300 [Streptomyces griseocarneus]|nr:hypothetical protein CTZ27_12300 [Streptomyces griseocarneus]